MENTNITSYESAVGPITISIESDLKKYLNESLLLNPDFIFSDKNPNIVIKKQDSTLCKLDIYTKNNVREFSVKIQNLNYYFQKLILLFFDKNLDNEKKSSKWDQKTITALNKNFFLQSYLNTLDGNLYMAKDIVDFSIKLFQLNPLKNFESIYLFIHRKASSLVHNYHIKKNENKKSSVSLEDFTELFNSIKKSKNKSFGQESLKGSAFQILGTCIALEFSLRNYNVIFIISNDDFLPQKSEHIDFFTNNKDLFYGYFNIVLENQFNREAIENYFDLLTELDFLTNDITRADLLENDLIFSNFKNTNLHKFHQKIENKYLNIADIHHQERISLLGELLNTLKHELSNPLFGLQLSSELLVDEEKLDEDQREFIQQIHSNILRSQKIISNFSGLYLKNDEVENVDIIAMIEEIFTLTKSESREIKKTIINKTEKPVFAILNPTWLAQILFNLVINSSQALKEAKTQNPQIIFEVSQDSKNILLTLKDNGPGIPSSITKEIFNPFCTTKDYGTGLGLTISKRLAQKMNAKLDYIQSETGAIFQLEI